MQAFIYMASRWKEKRKRTIFLPSYFSIKTQVQIRFGVRSCCKEKSHSEKALLKAHLSFQSNWRGLLVLGKFSFDGSLLDKFASESEEPLWNTSSCSNFPLCGIVLCEEHPSSTRQNGKGSKSLQLEQTMCALFYLIPASIAELILSWCGCVTLISDAARSYLGWRAWQLRNLQLKVMQIRLTRIK